MMYCINIRECCSSKFFWITMRYIITKLLIIGFQSFHPCSNIQPFTSTHFPLPISPEGMRFWGVRFWSEGSGPGKDLWGLFSPFSFLFLLSISLPPCLPTCHPPYFWYWGHTWQCWRLIPVSLVTLGVPYMMLGVKSVSLCSTLTPVPSLQSQKLVFCIQPCFLVLINLGN